MLLIGFFKTFPRFFESGFCLMTRACCNIQSLL